MLKLTYFHVDVPRGISNLRCLKLNFCLSPQQTYCYPSFPQFPVAQTKIPWIAHDLPAPSCITQVNKSYALFLQNTARIWPLLSISTPTTIGQAVLFSCLYYSYCFLNGLSCFDSCFLGTYYQYSIVILVKKGRSEQSTSPFKIF